MKSPFIHIHLNHVWGEEAVCVCVLGSISIEVLLQILASLSYVKNKNKKSFLSQILLEAGCVWGRELQQKSKPREPRGSSLGISGNWVRENQAQAFQVFTPSFKTLELFPSKHAFLRSLNRENICPLSFP